MDVIVDQKYLSSIDGEIGAAYPDIWEQFDQENIHNIRVLVKYTICLLSGLKLSEWHSLKKV